MLGLIKVELTENVNEWRLQELSNRLPCQISHFFLVLAPL